MKSLASKTRSKRRGRLWKRIAGREAGKGEGERYAWLLRRSDRRERVDDELWLDGLETIEMAADHMSYPRSFYLPSSPFSFIRNHSSYLDYHVSVPIFT
jgi:hypothetical protein